MLDEHLQMKDSLLTEVQSIVKPGARLDSVPRMNLQFGVSMAALLSFEPSSIENLSEFALPNLFVHVALVSACPFSDAKCHV
jgi:hypothetical protein